MKILIFTFVSEIDLLLLNGYIQSNTLIIIKHYYCIGEESKE